MRRLSPFSRLSSAGVLTVLAGCGLADRLAPGRDAASAPARLTLTAILPSASRMSAGDASLDVVANYRRRDESLVPLARLKLPVTAAAQQDVPIVFDIAACLADPKRADVSGGRSCSVTLTLALTIDGVVVDRQVIGPLSLAPGVTSSVDQPVSLFEITTVELSAGNGPVLATDATLGAAIGESIALRAVVRDRGGQVVPGRDVEWTSSAPAVATVDRSGVLQAIGIGTARIQATIVEVSRSVSVRVARPPVEVRIDAGAATGRGRVRSTPEGIDCTVGPSAVSGACRFRFAADGQVTLRATADGGSAFRGWTGTCNGTPGEGDCVLSTAEARVVVTRFVARHRVAVIAGTGDGVGRVTGAGVDCVVSGATTTGTCSALFDEGSAVALEAVGGPSSEPGRNASFAGWSAPCQRTEATRCTYTVGASDGELRVVFHDARVLTVALGGDGPGAVSLAPGGECRRDVDATVSGTCRIASTHGTVVTLVARADLPSRFLGWTGDCAAERTSSCTVTLVGSRQVGATFGAGRRLSVGAADGDGSGRVRGPAGLDCDIVRGSASGTCAVVVADSVVDLTMVTGTVNGRQQTFAGWTGTCTASGSTCRVNLSTRDVHVGVRVYDEQHVGVAMTGAGGGHVSSSIGSVACSLVAGGTPSGSCGGTAPWGTRVVFTAAADPTSSFGGWSGDCDVVSGLRCTTTLTAARKVAAHFIRSYRLTVSLSGTVAGTLTLNGAPFCTLVAPQPATCTVNISHGDRITLSQTSSTTSLIGAFTSPCALDVPCVVTGDVNVVARFDPAVLLELQPSGAGGGRLSAPGLSCTLAAGVVSGSCKRLVASGATVLVTATPDASSTLTWPSGPCRTSPGATCTLVVKEPLRVIARFDPAP
ncbi:MAG: InlB B-repeat-containing protein [Gemmatimonadaceae bacterium]